MPGKVRHRWKKILLSSKQECQRCGCTKDRVVEGVTTYTTMGQCFFVSPECVVAVSNKEKNALLSFKNNQTVFLDDHRKYREERGRYVQFCQRTGDHLVELGWAQRVPRVYNHSLSLTDLGREKLEEYFPEILNS